MPARAASTEPVISHRASAVAACSSGRRHRGAWYVQVKWRGAMSLVYRLDRATFTRQNESPGRPEGCTP